MATRAVTIARTNDGREITRHYRHWDGYPETHGLELARALATMPRHAAAADDDAGAARRRTRWLDAYRAAMRSMGCEEEPSDVTHGDVEWLYEVTLGRDGQTVVRAWPVPLGHTYEEAMRPEPALEGSPRRFAALAEGREPDDEPQEADDRDDDEVVVEMVLEGPATASVEMTRTEAERALDALSRATTDDGLFALRAESGDEVRVRPDRILAICVRRKT